MSRVVRAAGGGGRWAVGRQLAAGWRRERREERPADFLPPPLEAEWFGPRGMRCSVRRIVAGRNHPTGGRAALRRVVPPEQPGDGPAVWGHRAGLRGPGWGRWRPRFSGTRREAASRVRAGVGRGAGAVSRGCWSGAGWRAAASVGAVCVPLPSEGFLLSPASDKKQAACFGFGFPEADRSCSERLQSDGEASLLQSAAQVCRHARDCQAFRMICLLLFMGLAA